VVGNLELVPNEGIAPPNAVRLGYQNDSGPMYSGVASGVPCKIASNYESWYPDLRDNSEVQPPHGSFSWLCVGPISATPTVHWHPHQLKRNYVDSGWACDGRQRAGGCKSGITGFYKQPEYPATNVLAVIMIFVTNVYYFLSTFFLILE